MDAKLICQTIGVALTNAKTPNFRGGKSEYFFETLLAVGVPFGWILRGGGSHINLFLDKKKVKKPSVFFY
jgi:hypothetical protein